MKLIHTKGIAVQTYLSGESSLVAIFITADYGKLKAFAPQARKSQKRFARLDTFDFGTISCEEQDKNHLHLLKEFKSLSSFPSIRESLDKLFCVSFITEVCEQLTPEADPHCRENFSILLNTLQSISECHLSKDYFKNLQNGLFNLLIATGFEINQKYQTPTLLNLTHLLHYCEEISGRKIHSKENMLKLLQEFSRKSNTEK